MSVKVPCPALPSLLRSGDSLSPRKEEYMQDRCVVIKQPQVEWFELTEMKNLNPELSNKFHNPHWTCVLLGGRAIPAGAGQSAALDSRTPHLSNPGYVGGLVQAASYITGLSGGNWLVDSIVLNNLQQSENSRVLKISGT